MPFTAANSAIARRNRIHRSFAPTMAAIAAFLVLDEAAAATTAPPIGQAGMAFVRQVRADVGDPHLVVRLNADGSLLVSQSGRDVGAPIALPSVKALPAEIDTLVPNTADRKTIAIAADSTGPYTNLDNLVIAAVTAGYTTIAIPSVRKTAPGQPAEMTLRIVGDVRAMPDPLTEMLFVSQGEDGQVILTLGFGVNARSSTENLAVAPAAMASLVPKDRPHKQVLFRANFNVPVGSALGLLQKLDRLGFKKIGIVAEEPP